MLVYPYTRLPKAISDKIPENFHVAVTENGWMTSKLFYEFIANPFIEWLDANNIARPIILFVDGHKTHMTLQTSVLCEDNGIILYLLPPNTTHILQPADVGPFRPMKHFWREEVVAFQRNNPGVLLQREDVAPLLERVLHKVAESSIVNGFRKTGLHPFNVEAVDYSRCLDIDIEDTEEDVIVPEKELTVPLNYEVALECIKAVLGEDNYSKCLDNTLDADTVNLMVRVIANKVDGKGTDENLLEEPGALELDITSNADVANLSSRHKRHTQRR